MNMHIFIIINILQTNKTVDFVIHLTRGEDHKVIYYALPYMYACYIHVVFCHGSTPGARDWLVFRWLYQIYIFSMNCIFSVPVSKDNVIYEGTM